MKFLKFIVAVMTMFLLYFFVGNVLQYIFPAEASSTSSITGEDCYEKHPYPMRDDYASTEEYQQANTVQSDAREACTKAQAVTQTEKSAASYLKGLYRGMVILFVCIGIAIVSFRRYPYLASALVLVGVAFVALYPFTVSWGDLLNSLMYGEETATLRQIQLMKTLLQGLGVTALIAADVLFFEKGKLVAPSSSPQA